MNNQKSNVGIGCASGPASCEESPRDFGMAWWEHQREHVPGFELIPHIVRLLAEGEPLSLDRLAAASSWSLQDVEAAVHRHPGVDWDDNGRLVGFGLTLRPTPHRFSFDARTVFAFCASDALIFPICRHASRNVEI